MAGAQPACDPPTAPLARARQLPALLPRSQQTPPPAAAPSHCPACSISCANCSAVLQTSITQMAACMQMHPNALHAQHACAAAEHSQQLKHCREMPTGTTSCDCHMQKFLGGSYEDHQREADQPLQCAVASCHVNEAAKLAKHTLTQAGPAEFGEPGSPACAAAWLQCMSG